MLDKGFHHKSGELQECVKRVEQLQHSGFTSTSSKIFKSHVTRKRELLSK